MSRPKEDVSWVVYQMSIGQKVGVCHAVCEQGEWDAMELARPGYHTLIQGGITSEGEAEKLARSSQTGDDKSSVRLKQR